VFISDEASKKNLLSAIEYFELEENFAMEIIDNVYEFVT
jgi:hypothetical protein